MGMNRVRSLDVDVSSHNSQTGNIIVVRRIVGYENKVVNERGRGNQQIKCSGPYTPTLFAQDMTDLRKHDCLSLVNWQEAHIGHQIRKTLVDNLRVSLALETFDDFGIRD